MEAMFFDLCLRDVAAENRFLLGQTFEETEGGLVAFRDTGRVEKVLQRVAQGTDPGIHAEGKCLHDKLVVIFVDDESWKEIAFAVNEAKRLGSGEQSSPEIERARQPLAEKRRIGLFYATGKQPDGNERMRMIESDAEGQAARRQNLRQRRRREANPCVSRISLLNTHGCPEAIRCSSFGLRTT